MNVAPTFLTKRHGDIAKAPEWGDEGCFYFIGTIQSDLMISGICIYERQVLAHCGRVNNLIDARERKVIFRAGPIDMLEINAHTK